MADQAGARKNARKKSVKLNYFYLDGKLYKKLHINRGADTLTAWCYPEHRRVAFTYSDVRKHHGKAFTMTQVGKMLKRGRVQIQRAIIKGDLEPPQHTYGLENQSRKFKYLWSEKDVMAAHAYFSTVHRGRPRKDGLVSPQALPTARELRAMMRNQEILYVKEGDSFIPTWDAEQF